MKQTGLITLDKETDYLAGTLALESVMPSKDWRPYAPKREKQYDYKFDTLSCTTFSILNVIEHWINYFIDSGKLPPENLKTLTELGFMENGEFNASDRFTAIMSGTTKYGNYHQAVFDSIRHNGLLPEKDLPFGGKNWEEYHDKTKITEEMKFKAKKILDIFEWVYEKASDNPNQNIGDDLEHSPLAGAIPFPAYHAVVLPTPNYIFDTYPPFLYERQVPVHYSFKFITKIKSMNPKPYVELTRTNSDSVQTIGMLEAYNNDAKFTCRTLELAWKNNFVNISCIPVGRYTVDWTWSPKFQRFTYEVKKVPNRDGIRFHSANYFYDLNGCIGLGERLTDINRDDHLDIVNSRVTVKAFEDFMQRKSFTLNVL